MNSDDDLTTDVDLDRDYAPPIQVEPIPVHVVNQQESKTDLDAAATCSWQGFTYASGVSGIATLVKLLPQDAKRKRAVIYLCSTAGNLSIVQIGQQKQMSTLQAMALVSNNANQVQCEYTSASEVWAVVTANAGGTLIGVQDERYA